MAAQFLTRLQDLRVWRSGDASSSASFAAHLPSTPSLFSGHLQQNMFAAHCQAGPFSPSATLSFSRVRSVRQNTQLHAVRTHVGSLVATDLKLAVVVARFNDLVTKLLLEGALEAFQRHGCAEEDVEVVWVPGSFELPVVAKSLARSGKYDAILCIGAVVRGATTHYEAVAGAAASGLLGASTDTGVPVIFGVLTTETMEQALDRAGGKLGNKGGETAVTAIEVANLMKALRQQQLAERPWLGS